MDSSNNKRVNSDSMLCKKIVPNVDTPIDHFLPKFLLNDLYDKDESRFVTDSTRDENIDFNFSNLDIYDSHEDSDPILEDFQIKDVNPFKYPMHSRNKKDDSLNNINPNNQQKFYSSEDAKKFAVNFKADFQNQFKNHVMTQNPCCKFNVNYNLKQNFNNQNINQQQNQNFSTPPNKIMKNPEFFNQINSDESEPNFDFNTASSNGNFQIPNNFSKFSDNKPTNHFLSNMYQGQNPNFYSAQNSPWKTYRTHDSSSSLNNSYNLSSADEFVHINSCHTPSYSPHRMGSNSDSMENTPKKINIQSIKKSSSLFLNNDKEEKADDFNDLEELLNSIDCELWVYARSQKGSRNLQKLLNKILPNELDVILEKIKDYFSFLMTDTYGNYFCQKLIQCCSSEQRIFILKNIQKDFCDISCNASGTHAIQSLIEIVNLPMEEDLLKLAVENYVLKLSYDINGTHVIQKVLSCIKEEDREKINEIILENLDNLVADSNGIYDKKRAFILNKISKNSLEIVQNPFGNYVIQHILDEWGSEVASPIIEIIIKNIISLSMQKFSSNVVEKCFDMVNRQVRKRMIKELFNTAKISSLLKNKYGNYVLQKAIQIMSIEEKIEIKDYLIKRVSFTSNKEKARLNSLIEII